MKHIFVIKGLDCPNCALELEREISKLDGVTKASITFATETLTLETTKDVSLITPKIEHIVKQENPSLQLLHENSQSPARLSLKNLLKLVGVVLFVLAVVLEETGVLEGYVCLALFLPAYLLVGFEVLNKCRRNIVRGRFFDEHLLMVLATFGAFMLGEYLEAVSVMIFYQLGELFNRLAVRRSRAAVRALILSRGGTEEDVANVEQASSNRSKSEQFITRFAKVYTPIVIALAVVVAVLPIPFNWGNPNAIAEWVNRGLLILLVSCPCAILLSVPVCYFGGLGAASRCGVLVNGGAGIDALYSMRTLSTTENINEELSLLKISLGEGDAYLGSDREKLSAAKLSISTSANAPADVILASSNRIVSAVRIARRVRLLVVINLVLIFSVKIAVVALSLSGLLTSLLLAELADVGVAALSAAIAITILLYNPQKTPCSTHTE